MGLGLVLSVTILAIRRRYYSLRRNVVHVLSIWLYLGAVEGTDCLGLRHLSLLRREEPTVRSHHCGLKALVNGRIARYDCGQEFHHV